MGRPPKPKAEKQSRYVSVGFTPAEHRVLQDAAGDESLASYIRQVVLRHLSRKR